jgi:hypothetical protein
MIVGETMRIDLVVTDPQTLPVELVDASEVTVTVKWRSGTKTTVRLTSGGVVRDAVGTYHANVVAAQSGRAHVLAVADGLVVAVMKDTIEIEPNGIDET